MRDRSQLSPWLLPVAVSIAVVLVALGVFAGMSLGRMPQASGPASSVASATVPQPESVSPSASEQLSAAEQPSRDFDPADYNTAMVQAACEAGDFEYVAAQSGSGQLLVHVGLTRKLADDQQLLVNLWTDSDDMIDDVVTYYADANSSHLWDGEDEDSFVLVTGTAQDDAYEVVVPVSELEPKTWIRLSVQRWTTSEESAETCNDVPLTVR